MDTTAHYQTRIVAFVDILGFRDLVKQSEKNFSKVAAIINALGILKAKEKADQWTLKLVEIEEDAQKKGLHKFDISKISSCTCFSDSIIVSVDVEGTDLNAVFSTLIINLSVIGSAFMKEGILIRGGITIGNLIHTDTGVIVGQGLIDAYDLESKIAKFPRIVLSDKLIQQLNYPLDSKKLRYPYHQYLQRFDDGCVGFHQLVYLQVVQSWVEMSEERLAGELKKVKLAIIGGLDSSFQNPDIYMKYLWLKKEYDNLIIFPERLKEPLHALDEGLASFNLHYSTLEKYNRPVHSTNDTTSIQ